jgi:hypothetical protein
VADVGSCPLIFNPVQAAARLQFAAPLCTFTISWMASCIPNWSEHQGTTLRRHMVREAASHFGGCRFIRNGELLSDDDMPW